MWKAIKYFLLFFACQVLVALVAMPFGDILELLTPVMGISSFLFCLYIFLVRKKVGISRASFGLPPWQILLLGVGAVLFFIPLELKLNELLSLTDELEIDEYSGTFLELLVIGLVVPVAEELLMRGVVLGALLQWRPAQGRPWLAILLSATLFSVMHFNPAQIPGSFMMGILMGWLCYRTGSLLPGIVMHVFNNSTACFAEMLGVGDGANTFSEMFGSPVLECLVLGVSFLMLIIELRALVRAVGQHYPAGPPASEPAAPEA